MSSLQNIGLNVVVAFAAGVWALLLLIQGSDLPGAWWKPFSLVVGAVVLILEVFEFWGWRIPWLHPWLVGVPDLNGLWRGELTTQWIDPKTGIQPKPIQAFIVVRQTFSRISIRVLTRESSSSLLAGQFTREQDGEMVLTGTYRNTPRIEHRERSPIHYGGLLLQIPKQRKRPTHLLGQYWTDRQSLGELGFAWVCNSRPGDFDSAEATFEQGET
jgi:hypothetical protein